MTLKSKLMGAVAATAMLGGMAQAGGHGGEITVA